MAARRVPWSRLVLLGLVAGVAVASVPARADSPIRLGQEFVVNGQLPEQQWRPQVSSAPDGEFVVVWGIYGADVFGQRFDSAGGRKGGEFQLDTTPYDTTGYEEDKPSAGVAADGSFVVVWGGLFPTDYGGYSLYLQQVVGRRYSTTGQPQGAPFIVNSDTTSYPYGPSVASAPDGRFVVVWMTPDEEVLGRRFDSAGGSVGGAFTVAAAGRYPTVSVAPDGSFAVTWEGSGGGGGSDGVFARKYDSAGAPQSGELAVSETPTDYPNHDVAAGADGRFVVTWQGVVSQMFHTDVLARRFDSTGVPQGPQFVVNESTGRQEYATPTVAPDGSFTVAWANVGAGDGYDYGPVVARRFDSTGAPVGGQFTVSNEHPVNAYWRRSIDSASASDGSFVVVWQSHEYYGREIVGQRIGTGLVGCTPAPKPGCKAPTVANRGVFRFRDSTNDTRDTFTWQWLKGEATSTDERGDPFAGTAYAFCLYDASGATQPLLAIESPAAGPCGRVACWRPFNFDTVEYFDRAHASAGLERIRLRSGATGVARTLVRAFGEKLDLPATPLVAPVTVQLQGSHGGCWTARYSSTIMQNADGQFRAKPEAGP
jgi:hypothetical protein